MNYCKTHSKLCENADEFGYCSVTACTKSEVWNNTYSSNITYGLATESKQDIDNELFEKRILFESLSQIMTKVYINTMLIVGVHSVDQL